MADGQGEPKATDTTGKVLEAAVKDPDVPKIYANAFGVGLSNADCFIVFQRFGTSPVAVVNLSYTLAKTLAQRLGRVVADFERVIGEQNILTTDRIDEAFASDKAAKKSPEAPGDDNVH